MWILLHPRLNCSNRKQYSDVVCVKDQDVEIIAFAAEVQIGLRVAM